MEDILASDTCICELAFDAVIKNCDTLVIDLAEIYVKISVSRTYELPRLAAPHLASDAVDVERLGLDTEHVLLA